MNTSVRSLLLNQFVITTLDSHFQVLTFDLQRWLTSGQVTLGQVGMAMRLMHHRLRVREMRLSNHEGLFLLSLLVSCLPYFWTYVAMMDHVEIFLLLPIQANQKVQLLENLRSLNFCGTVSPGVYKGKKHANFSWKIKSTKNWSEIPPEAVYPNKTKQTKQNKQNQKKKKKPKTIFDFFFLTTTQSVYRVTLCNLLANLHVLFQNRCIRCGSIYSLERITKAHTATDTNSIIVANCHLGSLHNGLCY